MEVVGGRVREEECDERREVPEGHGDHGDLGDQGAREDQED